MVQKWEYLRLHPKTAEEKGLGDERELLNTFGGWGWDLLFFDTTNEDGERYVWLKRELTEEPSTEEVDVREELNEAEQEDELMAAQQLDKATKESIKQAEEFGL